MDSAENLIAELERVGVTVWAEADRLRYKAPQGSLTPELEQRLTDDKGRLLALLSRADGAWRGARLPPIKKRADPKSSQLSYSQQQLWVLAQMLADSPAYNDQPFAYHLRGMLDVEALGQARFPDLLAFVHERIAPLTDLAKLQEILLLVGTTRTAEEVRQALQ